ncbi:hypothetical protein RVIR1_10440 [Candidatus Rickettsiella viridis]|uniref:Uncharacterized protein n=1 Tax=Candidatus Rickettsiella viridis TaxID=676208 RepID=A0A2Z5UUR6_9COXI|nr:hypothetical protein [Candidatus Rickettsiella viridis]BBB14785.1 hypothetical protein RVIR1_02540 [Candidatus Rickettsiella viridis]BBB15515.1 hypothetical protein RVIR1_10440 [Candidatus Rickettsiella viridis]
MFNLTETITHFNQVYQKRIKLNKTWGLVYLHPKSLDFLNQCCRLIQESVYHASPFVTQRRALRATLAKTQDQSTSEALAALKTIVQQLKTDELVRQRLDWEEHLQTLFNTEIFWQQGFNQLESNLRAKLQLKQIYQDWKKHRPFQYYSAQGLLFLLNVIVHYQYHFTQAHEELERKQQAWLPSQRLPAPIAASYCQFLERKLNHLKVLQQQVLEVLLLRLKIAEHRKQVTCDDVSYALVEQSQRLLSLSITLPKHQRTLDAATFNQIHRAIVQYGSPHHKNQLYGLAWYQYAEFSAAKDITLITISVHRLLAPTKLIHLIPKKVRKPAWLFRSNKTRFAFLERQQALLAQLLLPLDFTPLLPNSFSTIHVTLQPFILRYQLLQESLQSLEQQPALRWWQWRQKRWEKAWQKWLMHHFQKNQEDLREVLNHFFIHLQNHKGWLSQATCRQPLQDSLTTIQHLIEQGPYAAHCTRLAFLLKHLSTQLHAKAEEIARERHRAASLTQNFKQDVSIALEAYVKYYHDQGQTIPEARMADIDYLRKLLNTTHDLLLLREGVMQRYQTMQRPPLAKLMTSLDGSALRQGLRIVLEHPKYRIEQFTLAVASLPSSSQKVLYQGNNLSDFALRSKESIVDRQATASSIPDINNMALLTLEQQFTQVQTQIQQLMNNTDRTNLPLQSPDIVKNHARFFK